MMLLIGGSEASLRNIQHFTKDQQENQQEQDQHSSKTMMLIHRKAEEDDTSALDAAIDYLGSEECSDFVESMNDKVEQFLNDHDDDAIIEMVCSDEGVGKILRKEFELEASFDPDGPLTCESAFTALLVQEKDDVLGVIVDPEECKAEVQSELDGIHDSRRALEAILGGEGPGRGMVVTTTRDLARVIGISCTYYYVNGQLVRIRCVAIVVYAFL